MLFSLFLASFLFSEGLSFRKNQLLVKIKGSPLFKLSASFAPSSIAAFSNLPIQTVESLDVFLNHPQLNSLALFNQNQTENRFLLTFDPSSNLEDIILSLKENPDVLDVNKNYLLELNGTVNSPKLSDQWALSFCKFDQAWPVTTGNASVVVAVLDSGVDKRHPDLSACIIDGYDVADNDNNFSPDPLVSSYEHGTKVSSVIAAQGQMAGAAYGVSILPVKVMYNDGTIDLRSLILGIDYATSRHVDVVNMSLGGSAPLSDLSLLQASINNALLNNIFLVAAAGNVSSQLNSQFNIDVLKYIPATLPGICAVSGVNQQGKFDQDVSLYGPSVMIAAPDTDVLTSYLSILGQTTYTKSKGTSFSAPLVSGAVALMKTYQPNLSTKNIFSALQKSATDAGTLGRDMYYGYGILNAYKALAAVDPFYPGVNLIPLLTYQLSNENFIVTANVTDIFPEFLTVNVLYRFINPNSQLPSFSKQIMTKQSGVYSATLPKFPYATTAVEYRIEAADFAQNVTYYPSGTSSFSVSILDDLGPIVDLEKNFSTFFYDTSPLRFLLKDPNNVSQNFIQVILKFSSQEQTYGFGNTNISFSNNILELDSNLLKQLPFNQAITFTIKSADLLNNFSTYSFQLIKDRSFLICGPSGKESNPINTPNPFNPNKTSTNFCFEITRDAWVEIDIYDLSLRKIKSVLKTFLTSGYYQQHTWDGRDEFGQLVPNGVYVFFIKVQSEGITLFKKNKIVVLK